MKIDFGLWLKVKMSSRQVNSMTFQIHCSFFYCVGTKLSCELDLRKTLRHPMNIDFELWPNVNMSCFPEEHKMPHLVVSRTFVLHMLGNHAQFQTKPTPTTTPKKTIITNNTKHPFSLIAHIEINDAHTKLHRHPHADTHRHLSQTCTHIYRRVVTDFCWRPVAVLKNFVMTDGPAPKRQRIGNHDDLVSGPVTDVSPSENTTQT